MGNQDHINALRASVGHTALAVVEHYGEQAGEQMLRVYVESFSAALASLVGWAETIRVVNAVAAQHGNPNHMAKPHLVVNNESGREIA